MDNMLETLLNSPKTKDIQMRYLFEKLMRHGSDSYRLKGKRVLITDVSGNTLKIPYEDFFKISMNISGDEFVSVDICKKDGVDILVFLTLGMCLSLNYLGLNNLNLYDRKMGDSIKYLSIMSNFASKDMSIVNNTFEYNYVIDKFNKIFFSTGKQSSEKVLKKNIRDDEYKSLYFAHCLGTSSMRPNVDIISDIFPYLLCLATTEDGRKRLIETFCSFAPLISFSCMQIFSYRNRVDHINDSDFFSSITKGFMFENKELSNINFSKVRVNKNLEVTDIDGVSLLLSYIFSTLLFFGDNSFLNDNKKFLKNKFDDLVGNDFIRDYLLSGDMDSYVSFLYKKSTVGFEHNDDVYSLSPYILHMSTRFFYDIENLNVDLETFIGCASLSTRYATYNECVFRLTEYGGLKLVNSHSDSIISLEKKHNSSISYYKKRNKSLSDKNKELMHEIKNLKLQLDKLSKFSTSVREDEHESLKNDYALAQSKIATLEEKCNKLENKYSEVREDMHSLINSLEKEDDNSDNAVSIEEMIEFLNGFNICIVGGRSEMSDRLHEMGLHNFTQYLTSNELSRLGNFDFMVSMTRFMSHNTFYNALNRLGSERDKHCYFNGTNLNSLINVCYDFINKYFDIS